MQPESGDDVTLVLPEVSTRMMKLFLAHFAQELAPDTHAIMVLDQAGWHAARTLRVPDVRPRTGLGSVPDWRHDEPGSDHLSSH